MNYIGIDIGSTASKTVVLEDDEIKKYFVLPTGWNSKQTAKTIKAKLARLQIDTEKSKVIATGYGRVSVPYADKNITEITCHARGGAYLMGDTCTIVDIGGQDTKVISVENNVVTDFIMNDKCSAGTGRFIEIMASRLGVDIPELCELARSGGDLTISSMCTVFAESEVISHVANGEKKEDIAYAVIDSVVTKVTSLCNKHGSCQKFVLTGGLCDSEYIIEALSKKLKSQVISHPLGRYAGAIGAALIAKEKYR